MVEVHLDGCKCVCDNANVIAQVMTDHSALEIVVIVIIVLIVVIGLIIGFKKLKEPPEEEEYGETYY